MKKPALLIIDMQNDFVRDGAPLKVSDAGLIIGKIQSVLDVFRRNRLPVFHVIRVHRRDVRCRDIPARSLQNDAVCSGRDEGSGYHRGARTTRR